MVIFLSGCKDSLYRVDVTYSHESPQQAGNTVTWKRQQTYKSERDAFIEAEYACNDFFYRYEYENMECVYTITEINLLIK
jgi:hypothetical protein